MKKKKMEFPQIIPKIEDWPIFKLSENRKIFVKEIEDFVVKRLLEEKGDRLTDFIAKTVYLERIRIKEDPWKVDPADERQFWGKLRKQLGKRSPELSKESIREQDAQILRQIVHRYAEEIVGTFRVKVFLFARRFLTGLFTRLLNAAAAKTIFKVWGSRYRLQDRFQIKGEIRSIRSLFKKGTMVVLPTHFSNLDSIVVGYAMDTFAGLPSFSYGAGLNLYNSGVAAYFINRLGAYRVDRRKKNPIYLETLKAMSNLSLQRGTNSLFFPGGTRSRSGKLESRLKLGLLGTVVEAQRANYESGKDEKIFVVPLIINYHFVLEAQFLVEQYLRRMGKERYIRLKDDFNSLRKILYFAWALFSKSNDLVLSVAQPMDVLGHAVDEEGNSYDKFGNKIDVKEYFESEGKVVKDLQRESEYTKILAERVVERYHKDNIVLSSHLVAFAGFQLLLNQNAKLDLYGILRLPNDEFIIPKQTMVDTIVQLQEALKEMEANGEIKLSDSISWEPEELIKDGIMRLGTYHVAKPLKYNKEQQIVSENFKLLYFYHNRMDGYQLEQKIQWSKKAVEMV